MAYSLYIAFNYTIELIAFRLRYLIYLVLLVKSINIVFFWALKEILIISKKKPKKAYYLVLNLKTFTIYITLLKGNTILLNLYIPILLSKTTVFPIFKT